MMIEILRIITLGSLYMVIIITLAAWILLILDRYRYKYAAKRVKRTVKRAARTVKKAKQRL
jgi:hypothetical protein